MHQVVPPMLRDLSLLGNEDTYYKEEMPLLRIAQQMMDKGIRYDKKIGRQLEKQWKEKQEKIEHRRELAIQYGLTSNALTVKAFRIRSALNRCLGECLQLLSDSSVINRPRLAYDNEYDR